MNITNRREVFWDDYPINKSRTSTELKMHSPIQKEIAFEFNAPWEGDSCDFLNIIRVDGVYRMYYLGWGWQEIEPGKPVQNTGIKICMLESADGINWTRPNFGLVEFNGSKDNNILLGREHAVFDNFYVFEDENPNCKPEERFKATAIAYHEGDNPYVLWGYTSSDGIHWNRSHMLSDKGFFDTLNVAYWDEDIGLYRAYVRGIHNIPGDDINAGVRDIRIMTSEDFINWTEPVRLDFGDAEDVPLYTNCVSRYPRAPHMLVGTPTRYVERKQWTPNFEQLTGCEARKERYNAVPRYGLATTDCILMTSRDGYKWNRHDDVWMAPGIERDFNWVYGDCYPTPGVVFTKSDLPGAPDDMSIYVTEGHWGRQPATIRRYILRQDGYLSHHAGRAERLLVTKPIQYEGGELSLNFATSAIGYIYVTLCCEGERVCSCELFGDTLDRRVAFESDIEKFIGKDIVLEFRMSDADLYSMIIIKD